jgi:hypothetical protein
MRALLAACTLGVAALIVGARTTSADAQKKFDDIVARYDKVQSDYDKALRDADDADRKKLLSNRPGVEFVAEFQTLATEAKGTEVAAKCWMYVADLGLDFGRKDEAVKALDTLVTEHVTSPALEPLPDLVANELGRILGKEKTEGTLRLLAEKSPHKSIQGASLFAVASAILRDKKASPERSAEARTIMERVKKDYAGVKNSRKQDLAELADATLFELDHLQIGKEAPDFEVTDENGVKFKLSDYRGKVVVIDFWGNW